MRAGTPAERTFHLAAPVTGEHGRSDGRRRIETPALGEVGQQRLSRATAPTSDLSDVDPVDRAVLADLAGVRAVESHRRSG